MSKMSFVAAVGAAVLFSSVQAQAVTTVFTDRAAFLAASGTATNHTTPVISPASSTAVDFGGISVGSISSSFFTVNPSPSGISNALVFSDRNGENFDVLIDDESFGFGFDIFEPAKASLCNTASCVASTFSVTLLSGSTTVGSVSFTPPPSDTETSFFGVTSTVGFNFVEIRETTGTNDNESFGAFTTTAAIAPVPLPASFMLLLAGLGGMTLLGRRKTA